MNFLISMGDAVKVASAYPIDVMTTDGDASDWPQRIEKIPYPGRTGRRN